MTVDEDDVSALVRRFAGPGAGPLDLAVAATRLADLATRVARTEVMNARDGGATWAAVGEAFGVSTQTAHERFRSGPDGLHSRYEQQRRRDGPPRR